LRQVQANTASGKRMALIADHTAREMLSREPSSVTDLRPPADRIALKCRPAPSLRAPPTTMPYAVCLRLAGAWIAGLAVLLAVVLALR
jgi:hypothetical protein